MSVYEPCFMCGEEALTKQGVIYVRAEIKGKWGNHIICMKCYKIHYRPDRDAEAPPKGWEDYTEKDFRKDCADLKKLKLILEKPKNDFHLTPKGSAVARSLALNKDTPIQYELSERQVKILSNIYIGD